MCRHEHIHFCEFVAIEHAFGHSWIRVISLVDVDNKYMVMDMPAAAEDMLMKLRFELMITSIVNIRNDDNDASTNFSSAIVR